MSSALLAAKEVFICDATDFKNPGAWPLWVKMTVAQKGAGEEPHTHPDGHFTWLAKGRALFYKDGKMKEYAAPAMIWTDGGVPHHIIALEDDTHWGCIHDRRAMLSA